MLSPEPVAESRADWVAVVVGGLAVSGVFLAGAVFDVSVGTYWVPVGLGAGLLMVSVRYLFQWTADAATE